ncbi:BMC domain-containing protein [Fusobacterium sp.]|uniref:BMC domain-containing protein n=1 Tax=unclassified Fusobacterium TaxID=2648384 RepID=UPI0025C2EAB2|nr:BMC domain-containing protein [Fusobacterium sp.]
MISSLGLIEVVGLVGAIEAGDTAVKAANVRLIGIELTKGGGMVTVKIEGEVSAVTAAVEAGVMAAERLTTVVSKLVIARPSVEVGQMVEPTEVTEEVVEEIKEEVEEKQVEEVVEQEKEATEIEVVETTGKKNRKNK